jgi:glycosyltransferase involved in cell wall biosynthesis
MKNTPGFTAAQVEALAGFASAVSEADPAQQPSDQYVLDSSSTVSSLNFSVVVCAYSLNRWEELLLAVQSLEAQVFKPLEVIVVIDHNAQLFAQAQLMARTDGAVPVQVLENQFERGLSGARNSGLRAARGEVVAFLDDDAIAAVDWLERLVVAYRDPKTLGVGGAIIPMWRGPSPDWFPPEFFWVIGCTYLGLPEQTGPVRNMIGANMSHGA